MPKKSAPSSGAERRRHPRLSMPLEVDLRSEHNFYSCRTRDMSVGGLFVETNIPLAIGTPLTVDLKFMKRRFQIAVEVVWSLLGDDDQPAGVGVRFIHLTDAAKKNIQAFMALREPMMFEMVSNEDDEPESTTGDPGSVIPPA